MSPLARCLPLLLLPTLGLLACGDKDKAGDDPKGDGGSDGGAATGDGGGLSGDGGGEPGDAGTEATTRSVRVHLSLHLRQDDQLGQAIPDARLFLRGADGSTKDLPEPTDLSGQTAATLELDEQEWTACWTLPRGTTGCDAPISISEGGRARAWVGVDFDPSRMIKGRLTLGDGTSWCSNVGALGHCGWAREEARPTVRPASSRYPDAYLPSGPLLRPDVGGAFLIDAAPGADRVVAAGGSGAEAEAEVSAAREVELSLPIPVPQLYSRLTSRGEDESGVWLKAVVRKRDGDRLDSSVLDPAGVFTSLRGYSNGRSFALSARASEARVPREAGDETLQVCGETDHFLVACDRPRVLTTGEDLSLLVADGLADRRLSPAGETLPVEGEDDLIDADNPQTWVEPGFYWLNGPGLAPSSVHIPELATASLLSTLAPCLVEAQVEDTALMERSSGGGATTWTATDGLFSLRIPDGAVRVGREPLPDTAVPRLAILRGEDRQPMETIGQSGELFALSPLLSVWLSFDDESGAPLDAQIVTPVALKVALDHTWRGEKTAAIWTGPGPRTKLEEPIWQGTRSVATVDGGYASLEVSELGWATVAEPFSPGCVTVYADEWSGYTTIYATWTSSSGQTVRRSWPITQAPVVLGGLPLGQSVTLSLGGACEPDPATARTVSVGRSALVLPWDLGPDAACTEVVLPELPTVPNPAWLTRHRLQDVTLGSTSYTADDLAESYYETIDPDDDATTLEDWKQNVCGWPLGSWDVKATYQNRSDLGFIRDMYSYTGSDGRVCMYVTNYPDFGAYLAGQPIATVAMDWAPDPRDPSSAPAFFTRFYVFDAPGTGRLTSIDLDGTGPRAVPQLCMNCHGGSYVASADVAANGWAGWGDVGARFLPFDASAYGYLDTLPGGAPSGIDAASQQEAFRQLNEAVLRTQADAETRAMIHRWYGSTATSSNSLPVTTPDFHALPAGWTGSLDDQDVYLDVASRHCLLCHTSHADVIDFDTASEFQGWSAMIHYDLCQQRQMPHALRTFQNLYQQVAPHPTTLLADYLGTGGAFDPWAGGCTF